MFSGEFQADNASTHNAEVGSSSLPPATRILSILILFAYRFCQPIVNQSVDKTIEYDDLQAYQEQQQLKRQLELDKIRAEENKKREQQLEVERLKKGFGRPVSTYRESKYIYRCNPYESINKGRLGSSQLWRQDKKKYEYY